MTQAQARLPKPMQRPGGRTERVRRQVVAATVALLAEDGVAGITVDSVATRSEVARTTIYRRWGTPEALMLEALREELGPRARRPVDTGSLRGDLTALLQDVTAFSTSDQGRGIMQAVFIQRSSPVIASEVSAYWTQRFAAAGEIVRRAIDRGELGRDLPERLVMEMAAAPVYLRLFITHEPVDDAYLAGVVEFVLVGCGARDHAL
ncbi:MAG TPA: TetR/AcrR family transcriptional regulator [Pseudonocardia sp.]|jgi:AcrR family transcriptional regulator